MPGQLIIDQLAFTNLATIVGPSREWWRKTREQDLVGISLAREIFAVFFRAFRYSIFLMNLHFRASILATHHHAARKRDGMSDHL